MQKPTKTTATAQKTTKSVEILRPQLIGIPKIGEYWPGQGGFYAGMMPGINGGPDYCLIVAGSEFEFSSKFGCYGRDIDTSIFDGLANTQLMLSSGSDYPAAKKCTEITIDGHTDFYLWARREARLASVTISNLFDKTPWYLTSTQYSADYAYVQDFEYGYQYNNH